MKDATTLRRSPVARPGLTALAPDAPDAAEEARLMGLALELARQGEGRTHPNPMVGSVVVRAGQVVGRGFHRKVGEEHAEIEALAQAGAAARGATLYSTLEPCCHQGRTPPCVGRIVEAGIRRVVAALQDADPRVDGRGFDLLRQAGIEVSIGTLAAEAERLNEDWTHFVRTGRPFVTLKAGMSLDGRIAPAPGAGGAVTSAEARAEALRLRGRCDAVLVGAGTVRADDPLLSARAPELSKPILRAVLDSDLCLPPTSQLFRSPESGPVVVYHSASAPHGRIEALRRAGAMTVEAGTGPRVSLDRVLADLGRRDIVSVLVEGGGEVASAFLSQQRVQRLCLFVAPRFLGPRGVAVIGPNGEEGQDGAWGGVRLEGVTFRRIGADVLVEGRPAESSE